MHKDLYYANKYGNIKTFIRTGFDHYGSTVKLEILAKYAEKLSQRLSFNDTIVIEFSHDYTNHFSNITVVEHGNPDTGFLLGTNLEEIESKQKKSHSEINGKSVICIRQFSNDLDIIETLKIIEYCILNNFENEQNEMICKSKWYHENKELINVKYTGIHNKKIEEIISFKTSGLLSDILNERVYFVDKTNLKGFYESGNYNFNTNNVSYKIKNLVYLNEGENGLFIFDSTKSFVYINNEIKKIKHFKIKSTGNYPYYTSGYNRLNRSEKLKDDQVYLYRAFSNDWIIFSIEKNKIIKRN